LDHLDRTGGRFVEPFVGGFNLVPALRAKAQHPFEAVCNDLHPGVIALYRALQDGWCPPPTLSEEQYNHLKKVKMVKTPLQTYAAIGCSFGGKEWGGFARNSRGDDYAGRCTRSLLRKAKFMEKVTFLNGDYRAVPLRDGDLVYLDPPYKDTESYKGVEAFSSEHFYEWCEATAVEWNPRGVGVFVSEFLIPDRPAWVPVWSNRRKVELSLKNFKLKTDYLIEVIGALV
jgi:DNA adenine methylase